MYCYSFDLKVQHSTGRQKEVREKEITAAITELQDGVNPFEMDCEWREFEENCIAISKTVEYWFAVIVYDDDPYTMSKSYFFDGRMQTEFCTITFPDFDESKLEKYKGE